MFGWKRKEVVVNVVGSGRRTFVGMGHLGYPDGVHPVKFNTEIDGYIGYKLDGDDVEKYYRHSPGVYYLVRRHSFSLGYTKQVENIEIHQIGDDSRWAGNEFLADLVIVNEDIYDKCIEDEALLAKRRADDWNS